MAIWQPSLDGRSGPKYLQIVEALADDIASGRLAVGARLPPHRELAWRLGVSPNTTGRAYAEAVSRALVTGEVGRGTFVRGRPVPQQAGTQGDLLRSDTGPIDLSQNLPLPGLAGAKLAETSAALGREGPLAALVDYQTAADLDRHASAAVEWLRRHQVPAATDETVITAGAQHGIFVSLMALARPGDLLLVEELTYAPVRSMAARLGLKLAAVQTDHEGLDPDHLDSLCRERSVAALYLCPTLQTPTGHTLGADRRRAIAEVARRHDLLIIEDDVFGLLHPAPPPPIATHAPERTIYLTSVSKCLAPGLRVGFVRAPSPLSGAIRNAVNLSCWMTPPLTAEIVARWISDGTADALSSAQIQAAARRQQLATQILGDHLPADARHGLHLWLQLDPDWSADALCARALDRNLKITNGAVFAAGTTAPNAVRICLGHEADDGRVTRGLTILRDILRQGPGGAQLVL